MSPELSIILPVYNEVESLPILWDEVRETIETLGRTTEVLFVDDGSSDGSTEFMRDLAKRDPRVRLLRFEANAGLSAAFYAGFQAARGEVVATMDSDLQTNPRDLVTLYARLANADAVVGWRSIRHDTWLKRMSSKIANAVRDGVTRDRVRDSACSLRLMRRHCLAAIPPFAGMHRFVVTLLHLAGYTVVEVPVTHRKRRYGRSKYGVRNRIVTASVDLLAVRWMMSRRLRYRVAEDTGGDEA
ncbi:MAG: glycosyltransferase family 2 protein [Candidatus Rokubacteria bacterium]|nr:glycosyltransferase family 2 protein [Candidatus Rokubacteria bacterium]